jgi:hypothetical protein
MFKNYWNKKEKKLQKNYWNKIVLGAGGVAEVVEHLPNNHEALSSFF